MKRTNVKLKMIQSIALFLVLVAATLAVRNPVYAQGPTWDDTRPADLVLGQPDFATGDAGTSPTALQSPYAVAVDPTTGKVFVADTYNHRVLRYASSTALLNGAAAEQVLGQADFDSGSANAGGAVGQDTLYSPVSVFVDSTGRLWVGDCENNRVLWWNNAATQGLFANANGVLGQADFTSNTPNRGVAVAANTLFHPYGLWVDEGGDLWVADPQNHRVLRWDDAATLTNGEAADGVLGQPDFTSNAANRGGSTAANNLYNPS
ncbi:MAG: hypothetical protein GVY30_01600, partial [Chloroflexi bacterium]|nr:hypothetical protein [Chloroflexota bacterium]